MDWRLLQNRYRLVNEMSIDLGVEFSPNVPAPAL